MIIKRVESQARFYNNINNPNHTMTNVEGVGPKIVNSTLVTCKRVRAPEAHI